MRQSHFSATVWTGHYTPVVLVAVGTVLAVLVLVNVVAIEQY